jgi:hypothetical protein
VDNGVTRRLGGDKPRHYIFDQAHRHLYFHMSGAAGLNSGQSNRKGTNEHRYSRKEHKKMISGLVNSMCYNEQKLKPIIFTNPSIQFFILDSDENRFTADDIQSVNFV